MFLSLGRYLCWWTISPRGYHLPSSQCFYHWVYLAWWTISPGGYHPPSSQCFYHWIDTSTGGLLVPGGIIRPVVSASITGRYLYWWTISPRGYHPPSSQCFYHCVYLAWWTISPRGYHPPSSQCFYHWADTSVGRLLVPEGSIRPVVSVSITGSIPLLVGY